jgi:capsular polysaccharide biosynthesis protein
MIELTIGFIAGFMLRPLIDALLKILDEAVKHQGGTK